VFVLKSLLFAGCIEFVIMVKKGTGNFEVFEGGAAVVSGTVRLPENISNETASLEFFKPQTSDNLLELSSRDIYKELRLRGYNYQGDFCGLVSLDNCGEC
jgi:fatty acid synthase